MLPRNDPDRIQIAFDDHRLVANAGLLLPVTLAHHLGLGELVDRHVEPGNAPGHAWAGDKLLMLIAGKGCRLTADVMAPQTTNRSKPDFRHVGRQNELKRRSNSLTRTNVALRG